MFFMPKNLEELFKEELQRRQQEQNVNIRRKIMLLLIIVSVLIGGGYLIKEINSSNAKRNFEDKILNPQNRDSRPDLLKF
jgi:hypothetical protein